MRQEQVQKTHKASTERRSADEETQSGTTDRANAQRASQRARTASRSAGQFLARTEK